MTKVNILSSGKIGGIEFGKYEGEYFIYDADLYLTGGYGFKFYYGQSHPSYEAEGNCLKLKDLNICNFENHTEIIPVTNIDIKYDIKVV